MPYYHIRVKRVGRRPPYFYEYDLSRKKLEECIEKGRKVGILILPNSFEWIEEQNIEDIDIAKTPKKSSFYGIGRLKGISIFEEGKIVTSQFIKKPLSRRAVKKTVAPTQETLSKNVFIVHGRDHQPLKELRAMLTKFGLNPIVLHEKASGSRTVVEKLERYSDVGYAFVVLTPDDYGVSSKDEHITEEEMKMRSLEKDILAYAVRRLHEAQSEGKITKDERKKFAEIYLARRKKLESMETTVDFAPRARQNVILEFGYFMGLLSRDRVCCLYKGDVELPSDMHGIVYIPFEDSVNEVKNKIIKELNEAGYKIKV